MKINELILSELRREPGKNPKIVGHESVIQKLNQMKNTDNIGISMTKLPKLGINPKSEYDTPIGVYFYPASYYLEVKGNQEYLPFQDDAKYIQIFQWNTTNVLDLKNVPKSEYRKFRSALEHKFGREKIKSIEQSDEKPLVTSPAGYLWHLLWSLTKDQAKPAIAWNKLLRELNIDVVIDNGTGIVHKNEPYQGIIINPRVIEHVDTIQQTYKTDTPTKKQHPIMLVQWAIDHASRLPLELEKVVLTNELATFQYLMNVRPQWPEGANAIMKDPMYATQYAQEILKKPWPQAEPYIAKDPSFAELYAKEVLKDPNFETWAQRYNNEITEADFMGRPCTKDCSGHRAGWAWAQKNQTSQKSQTPSASFNTGTEIAISQRKQQQIAANKTTPQKPNTAKQQTVKKIF